MDKGPVRSGTGGSLTPVNHHYNIMIILSMFLEEVSKVSKVTFSKFERLFKLGSKPVISKLQ